MPVNWRQYLPEPGTERENIPGLLDTLRGLRKTERAVRQVQVLTADQAKQYGVTLDEGWSLKLTPDDASAGYKVSYLTPEKYEVLADGTLVSPDGKRFTREQLQGASPQGQEWMASSPEDDALREQQLSAQGSADYFQQIMATLFPGQDIETILGYAENDPESFLDDIARQGQTSDSELLVKRLFPDITSDE